MTDERIKAVFEEYGQFVTGKEYALIRAIAEAVAPPRTWVGLTDEDMYVVSEEESCSFIAGAKWSEAILKEKNT